MADETTEIVFHPIEWEALKQRFEETPDGYLFHLDGIGKVIKKLSQQPKFDAKGFKVDAGGLGTRLQNAIQGNGKPKVDGRDMPKPPLEFVGYEEIRQFKKDENGYKVNGKIKVPAFRKYGNRTMYIKKEGKFPK